MSRYIKTTTRIRAVCFHNGRCGSTLLGEMAGSHNTIEWHGELLHRYHKSEVKTDDPWQLILKPLNRATLPVFGFETKFQHLNRRGLNLSIQEFVNRLTHHGFTKFVVLKRLNYLRQAISILRGQQTGRWHYRQSQRPPKPAPIHLDVNCVSLGARPGKLLDCFDQLRDTYHNAEQVLKPHDPLILTYEEDLMKRPQTGMRRLARYLDVRYQRPKIRSRRIADLRIEQLLLNFDEVQTLTQNTKYAWMIDN